MITIRMIKLCDASICKPPELIFKSCLENGKKIMWFQHTMKEKYLPISLLPVVEKIFERILYNNIYEFFTENNLISPNQSGFKPDDLCINQLLSITHEICKPQDDDLEIRDTFLDTLKTFDKVWHKCFLYKLKQNGISRKLFEIITNFLNFRKERVVLTGENSLWASIEAGIPQ